MQNLAWFKIRKDSTNLKSINRAIGKLLCMESKQLGNTNYQKTGEWNFSAGAFQLTQKHLESLPEKIIIFCFHFTFSQDNCN